MHTKQRLRGWRLQERPCFVVNRRPDKIVGSRVTNIELYRVVEFCKFYQIALALFFSFG
jgi:hypothetical protein